MAGEPWEPASVPVAEAALRCAWPEKCPPRLLRGAVLARMRDVYGDDLHSDWHGHLEGGDGQMARPAPVSYRTRGGPRVYLWGPRAHEHAVQLAEHLRALRLPSGDVLDVDAVDLDLRTDRAGVGRIWTRYRLVTPYYPASVAFGRRPTERSFRPAWAGQVLRRSILDIVETAGQRDAPGSPLSVQVEDYRDTAVGWRRPERGVDERVGGFACTFVANVVLPDGIGLGHHRSEGWGEVRVVDAAVRR